MDVQGNIRIVNGFSEAGASLHISCFLYFYFHFFFRGTVLQNGATLLQVSLEVIQYPLTVALEGKQYPLAKDYRVLATLWQICMYYLQKLPIPFGELVRGLPVTSDALLQICQRVANTLLLPVKNLPEGCQQPMAHCRGLPQLHTKGQPLCNTFEESKIQS